MIPAKLRDEIERWMAEGRYGNLQINFANGKIVNVNKSESFRVDLSITGASSPTTFNSTGGLTPGDTPHGH